MFFSFGLKLVVVYLLPFIIFPFSYLSLQWHNPFPLILLDIKN